MPTERNDDLDTRRLKPSMRNRARRGFTVRKDELDEWFETFTPRLLEGIDQAAIRQAVLEGVEREAA